MAGILQSASRRVGGMAQTAGRSSCLQYLSEMTINQLIIVYRTMPSVRNARVFGEEEFEGEDALDYFRHHTFWNAARVSVRLVCASLGAGVGSLASVGLVVKVAAASGDGKDGKGGHGGGSGSGRSLKIWLVLARLPTIVGFAIGDICGGKLVDCLIDMTRHD